jgi:hypothetical protein
MFERSRRYLHHIVEELERRGMPTNSRCSHGGERIQPARLLARARVRPVAVHSGTGKRYELAQNWWFDARRDIVASTSAALDYLSDVYEMHGDWQLALASYNWGEGAVARAIQKNRAAGLPTDYSNLTMPGGDSQLRSETAGAEEHHRESRAVRHRARSDPEPALFRDRYEDARHRRAARRAACRDAGRGIHGAQSGIQPAVDPGSR